MNIQVEVEKGMYITRSIKGELKHLLLKFMKSLSELTL